MKQCKKCGKKLRFNNTCGYCIKCKKTIVYYCIESNCNEKVAGPDRRCIPCGYKFAGIKRSKPKIIYYCIEKNCNNIVSKEGNRCWECESARRRKPKKIYHCIEPNCKNEVSEPGRRCRHHAQILRSSDPKEREKRSNSFRGAKNPNYRGGITNLYTVIRHLDESKIWRKSVFERDNYTCQHCNESGGLELHPHHKKQFCIILEEFLQQYSQFSLIEDKETLVRLAMTYEPFWDVSNGITLCKDCHGKIKHGRKTMIKRGN